MKSTERITPRKRKNFTNSFLSKNKFNNQITDEHVCKKEGVILRAGEDLSFLFFSKIEFRTLGNYIQKNLIFENWPLPNRNRKKKKIHAYFL